ncbi:MAG: iron-containing alcohol dehydrogenase family protein [Chloroflexi bacterium]|nr:iron-containing alcohol dehydrogenase family protein [Chloroflexota bacterium]MDA1269741.1 iron-containing alcohol dehydrogenase family protein [Chloroflexota bacterium]
MTTDPFRFVGYPVRVHAGPNAISKLTEEVDRTRAQRVLVVCGQSIANNTDLVERVREALVERFAGVFSGGKTGSPLTSVLAGVAAAREVDADGIVAVGGGSAVVTARGITILLAEKGTAQELCTQYPAGKPPVSPRLMAPKIPNFIVLTTATTAVTRAGTALIDPESGHRLELFDPKTRPQAVIWDDQALLTASPWLCLNATASCFTGIAAALQRTGLNPLAESDLLEALRFMTENLPLVESQPDNPAVRINLCAAAFLYNRATDAGAGGSALGVVTALAHSLDTRYPECGHGDAYSILTAPGMRFNAEANAAGQARFAAAMGVVDNRLDDRESAAAAADSVEELFRGLNLPVRLSQVGVSEDDIDQIAADAMTDFGLHRNVRKIESVDDLKGILASVR